MDTFDSRNFEVQIMFTTIRYLKGCSVPCQCLFKNSVQEILFTKFVCYSVTERSAFKTWSVVSWVGLLKGWPLPWPLRQWRNAQLCDTELGLGKKKPSQARSECRSVQLSAHISGRTIWALPGLFFGLHKYQVEETYLRETFLYFSVLSIMSRHDRHKSRSFRNGSIWSC